MPRRLTRTPSEEARADWDSLLLPSREAVTPAPSSPVTQLQGNSLARVCASKPDRLRSTVATGAEFYRATDHTVRGRTPSHTLPADRAVCLHPRGAAAAGSSAGHPGATRHTPRH